MESRFDFEKAEKQIYKDWLEGGYFAAPEANKAKKAGQKPFCIIMPPPNANDPLHMGHAMYCLQDILTRYHRMLGEASLWLPSTDHAGIETQFVFEKKLNKEGKSRFNFDRETLYRMIWDYVQENSGVAMEQLKRLGASADWKRFKFTLDEDVVEFVIETFKKLFKDGLVYRDERLVNFCTKCGTSYSELEVDHVEKEGKLYFIVYPLLDGGEIEVATTRPETMLGDTAVAVNPKDKRYKNLVGKMVKLPLTEREIPIVADEAVDMEFGTGAVKVTPAHDPNDWDMGERNNLPRITVIGFDGKMMNEAGKYAGMRVDEAREAVVTDLEKMGLLKKIEKHMHNVGVCYKCGRVIEPMPMAQFFIKVEPLIKPVIEALDEKKTKILGPGREAILRNWMEGLRDWNISRQIVWGIKIPVWYRIEGNEEKIRVGFLNKEGKFVKGSLKELLVDYGMDEIEAGLQQTSADVEVEMRIEKPDEDGWIEETDTFDTWFSSGQWPVVTLKTNKPGDFEFYYPTSVMDTAYDILIFWVMRMMMLGIYLTGEVPFEAVYLHGLIRDNKGLKMSKSKGNVINPIEMVDKYGADAVRMALVMSSSPGKDKSVGEEVFKGMRNFSNKIWNASRFVLMKVDEGSLAEAGEKDEEYKEKLVKIKKKVGGHLEKLRIGLAAEEVYNEFWHWYCDVCIEESKEGAVGREVMIEGLVEFLKMMHPFVPFVTEAVWSELRAKKLVEEEMLIGVSW